MLWKDALKDYDGTVLSVITNTLDVLEDPRFKSIHLCGVYPVGTKFSDKFVRCWDSDVNIVSRYIKADYIVTNKFLDFSRVLTSYLDNMSILTTEGIDVKYPLVSLPDHRRWVKNLIKLTLAFGDESVYVNCPDRLNDHVQAILGLETNFRSTTGKSIAVILYEGREDFNPKKHKFKTVYSNRPENLDVYKLQRMGYNFKESHSGFYTMVDREYELP